MLMYCSDLDRTVIFSGRFLKEYPYEKEIRLVEKKGDKEISYMSQLAFDRLQVINKNENIKFIPVTTRSIDEYNRVDLGFKPEWAIVACGGVLLHNGEVDEGYREYVRKYLNPMEMASILIDLEEMSSVDRRMDPRLIDGCYMFFKTDNEELFDKEAEYILGRYKTWDITRQRNKCYIIPKHISKQIAVRWLWKKLNEPYIVASGDSLLDVPMFAQANRVFIPSHSSLLKDKIVTDCTKVEGGIESPYITMTYIEGIANRLA